jgi:hypothetical protein
MATEKIARETEVEKGAQLHFLVKMQIFWFATQLHDNRKEIEFFRGDGFCPTGSSFQ